MNKLNSIRRAINQLYKPLYSHVQIYKSLILEESLSGSEYISAEKSWIDNQQLLF